MGDPMTIKKNYIIEKRNDLNSIRANGMSLQELRFFSIYLAKINSRDLSTRVVEFKISDFQKIMNFKGHLNIENLKNITNKLLSKVINIPNDENGYTAFTLFKKCKVYQNKEDGEWYVQIDANDESLELMFEFKKKYFTYELWNALQLKSSNQLRMYEILKQYERIGERIITITELRHLLGIKDKEYTRYEDFRKCVLDTCKDALKMYSDIQFSYEPTGKKGPRGKIIYLKFTIIKNLNYVDRLNLDDFLNADEMHNNIIEANLQDTSEEIQNNEYLSLYSECCNDEFNKEQLRLIIDYLVEIIPYNDDKDIVIDKRYKYLQRKYDELNFHDRPSKPIKNRFAYLKKLLDIDLKDLIYNN
jgi:plasmid replication initiation protein